MKKNLRNVVRWCGEWKLQHWSTCRDRKKYFEGNEKLNSSWILIKSSWKSIVFIDPNLPFQLFTAIEKNSKVSLEHLFKLKLSPFSAALAKSFTEIQSPDKPKLVESLKKFSNPPNIIVNNENQYFLYVGNLIYKMGNWEKQTAFQQITI